MQKLRQGDYFQTPFCFLKNFIKIKKNNKWSAPSIQYILIVLGNTKKKNKKKKLYETSDCDLLLTEQLSLSYFIVFTS